MSTKRDPTSLVTVGTEVTTPLDSASTKSDRLTNGARTQKPSKSRRRSWPRTRQELTAAYQPTPKETAILETHQHRRAAKPRSRVKVNKVAGKHQIRPDHPDVKIGSLLLMEAIGTDSFDFLDGLLAHLTNAGSQGREPDERGINFMLSVVQGIGPGDEVEAMLATQMAAMHMATMTFARRLAHVETLQQQDSAARAFTNLARTFTQQAKALKRYRTVSEQKVTVERVTVNAGGRAIVGHVSPQGKKADAPFS